MSPVASWTLARIRAHIGAIVAVGLIIGLAGAALLTAAAGTRRAATSYDRSVEADRAPHAVLTTDDFELWKPGGLGALNELEGVENAGQALTLAMRPVGTDFLMLFEHNAFGVVDGRLGTELNRFRILEGRAFDHAQEHEALVNPQYAQAAGIEVGDVVRFETWTADAVAESLERHLAPLETDGPVVEVAVTGIAVDLDSLVATDTPGSVYLTATFTERWGDQIGSGPPVGLVRLEDGAAGFERFKETAITAGEQQGVAYVVAEANATTAAVDGSIDTQVLALLTFLVVAGAVGLVTVYSTLTRLLSFAAADQRALRAMGVTRVQRVAALVLFTVPAAVVAALLAIGLAVPSSALLPIGTLRRLEPDPGIRIDVTALAVGAAAVVLVVLVLAAITAIGVTRVRTERQTVSESSTGRAVSSWARASVPATIGVRMALDPGHGDRALPTRSTLAGGVVGVLGVVAALSFGSSLHHLTSTPSLYGGTAEILIGAPGGRTEWLALAHELLANEDVDEVATFIAVSLYVEGETVLALIVDPRRGDPVNTIVSGRAPQAGHELVMGRYAADRFAVGEGDMVSIARTDGSEADYEVVGIAAHPIGTEGSYREQVAILGDSVEGLATLDAIPGYAVAVTLRDGVDVAATAERFRATGHHVGTRATPPAVGNLEEVNVFPLVLAVCLAILAISSVLHALTTTARRRRHEIALLRSLGFTPRQLRTMLLTQASSIAVVSLAIGVPMGLVVGRTAWSAVTDNLGVLEQHQLPLLPLAWLLSLAVIGLIALWTARGLVAVHPAAQLRTGRQE